MRVIRLAPLVLAIGAALVAMPLIAQENTLTGRVTDSLDQAPLPGAKVAIASLGISAITDNEGRYVLTFPAEAAGKTVEVRATLHPFQPDVEEVTLGPGAHADFALGFSYSRSSPSARARWASRRRRRCRSRSSSEEQIETTGAAETNQIIEALAPSFNFPRPTITDGTDSVRPATLRGLGSDQVLVLINGKRRHTSALVHVNGTHRPRLDGRRPQRHPRLGDRQHRGAARRRRRAVRLRRHRAASSTSS